MNTVLAQIASLILLDKAAKELGLDINERVCGRVKELALTLPGKNPTGYFSVRYSDGRTESVPVPTAQEMSTARTHKLEAVKNYKARTGLSLMAAKYAIEQFNGL